MRFIFLAAAISLICHDITLGEEPNEDRIGAILSAIEVLTVKVDGMEKKVNGIENKVDDAIKKVGDVKIQVGDVTKQVGDVKTQVGDVTKQVGEVKTQVGDIETQIGDVKTQVGDVTKLINVVDKKVEKVDSDVVQYNTWVFVGNGYQGSDYGQVYKVVKTLKECLEWCQTKRMSDGVEWNGVAWFEPSGGCGCHKNDLGHTESSYHLHFRAQ